MKRRLHVRDAIDISAWTALLTALFAIVLTVASRVPFLKALLGLESNLPDAVVVFASMILIFLYFFRREMKDDSGKLLELLQGPEFRVFTSSEEQVLYIASKINSATQSICDVSWIDYWGAHRTSPQRESADRAYSDAVKNFSAHKPYREIYVFDAIPTPNRERRVAQLRERAQDKNNGYYCAYLPQPNLPRLQFIIIDDEVVLHGFDGESTDVRCSVRHPEFARLYRAYYTRLWRAAVILKGDGYVDEKTLECLLKGEIPEYKGEQLTILN